MRLRQTPAPQAAAIESAGTRADRHAVWRVQHAFDDETRRALGTWGRAYLAGPVEDGEGAFAAASVALDLVECAELGAEATPVASGPLLVSPEDWWRRHAALPDLALRLWIRGAALGVSQGGHGAISANELTAVSNTLQSTTFRAFEVYIVATVMYLAVALAFRAAFAAVYWVVFVRGRGR